MLDPPAWSHEVSEGMGEEGGQRGRGKRGEGRGEGGGLPFISHEQVDSVFLMGRGLRVQADIFTDLIAWMHHGYLLESCSVVDVDGRRMCSEVDSTRVSQCMSWRATCRPIYRAALTTKEEVEV